ncbi:DUF2997 domain-containing protein [Dactylosporangium sp. AC04546]|uniref:DUF2997 domain-containing protein n=1 Tax=Dactylosporangium sp. AC04546 TaxID=2862460 RepID=UPI001EDFAA4F|nr:DUF2997 domain-containing protein [Dactylosporangium sp. AC04546]WVK78743.1 DUF2997 domain-containing protein [Dactylosporangium sp. AC04546]
MADEIVDVVIGPDGKVSMHVQGVDGMSCVDDTEQLVMLLGGDVEAQELTADAYVAVETDLETGEVRRQWS